MPDPITDLRAGLQDRYTLERELGHGGMATVFLAKDLRHERPVALKVLHAELAHSLGPERFLREIKLAARLQHPHILTVLDSGETAGRLWFTMPYVEGESLRDRLTRERQLPVAVATRIAREAALALGYAHEHGVIHRDIKPENILLTRDGTTLVADFGIARTIGATVEPQLTETGLAIGTAGYMSPEQATGERTIDLRSDIYSLGAVLYEMLAGEPAFTGPTVQAILARVLTQAPAPLSRVRPGAPLALDAVIARAMAILPADRFASAAELAAALETVGTTSTVAVPGARVTGTTRKRFSPALSMLVLGFVLGLGLLFAWRQRHPDGPTTAGARVIAVLPFENAGASEDDYFADGVTDAVRGKLMALPGIEVIASNSSAQYRHTTKTPQQIGQELGVQYLVIGKVRWSKGAGGSRVQVSPELIQVSTGRAKWQEPFDAALTDVFQVQAEIASRVASALDVALDAGERAKLAEKPTDNLEAYDLYLQAEALGPARGRTDPASFRAAIPLYQRAIALDPRFSDAWAGLSSAHTYLYTNTAPIAENARAAKREADSAIALAPTRPRGYDALGTYYLLVEQDPERSIRTLTISRGLGPPNADVLSRVANTEFNLGRFEDAVTHVREAIRLDPRSGPVIARAGRMLGRLRRYAEADSLIAKAITLVPDDPQLVQHRVMFRLAQGDLAGAKRLLNASYPAIPRPFLLNYMVSYNDLYWVLDRPTQDSVLPMSLADFDGDLGTYGLVKAEILAARGETRRAAVYADSGRQGFEDQVKAAPGASQGYGLLGMALTLMGRPREAVVQGEKAASMAPIDRNFATNTYVWLLLSRIYVRNNQPDKAIETLERLLAVPGELSRAWIALDPYYAPLRGNPRFEKLVAGK